MPKGFRGNIGAVSVRPLQVNPTAYTPAITWVNQTLTTISAVYLRQVGYLSVWGTLTVSGTGANGILTIPLPAGYTVFYPPGGANSIYAGTVNSATGIAFSLMAAPNATSAVTPVTTGAALTNYAFQIYLPMSA